MHSTEFHVVLVDDEPDVHEITRLALRKFRIYGLPVRLHSAASKAEGIELLNSLTLGRADISLAAVALIDVVMETDHAGLELCAYIRDVMKNRRMQLYVRTGQPGVAPERSVIDQYDIQGYLAKSEATEDKLYSMIKSGVRQYYWSAMVLGIIPMVRQVAAQIGSRAAMANAIQRHYDAAFQDRSGTQVESYANIRIASIFDGEVAALAG
jgi:CheY-like chemotaxis protein